MSALGCPSKKYSDNQGVKVDKLRTDVQNFASAATAFAEKYPALAILSNGLSLVSAVETLQDDMNDFSNKLRDPNASGLSKANAGFGVAVDASGILAPLAAAAGLILPPTAPILDPAAAALVAINGSASRRLGV